MVRPENLIRGSTEKRNGVIAGTGFSEKATDFETIHTDYGNVKVGHLQLGEKDTIFLARHQHLEAPNAVNYRANVQALKLLGVNNVWSVSAAGRMAEDVLPGHLVNIDDLAYHSLGKRETSFAEKQALLLHTPLASPFSEGLRDALTQAWFSSKELIEKLYESFPQLELSAGLHNNGTYFNCDPRLGLIQMPRKQ